MRRRGFLKAALGGIAALVGVRPNCGQEYELWAEGECCGRRYLENGECPEDLVMSEFDEILMRHYKEPFTESLNRSTCFLLKHDGAYAVNQNGTYSISLHHENGFADHS